MKIEFSFNSTTVLRLTPENSRDKQLIALFVEGAPGIRIVAASSANPEALVVETFTLPPKPKEALADQYLVREVYEPAV